MYTLKTIDIKTNSTAQTPGERLMLWVDAEFTNGIEDIKVDFKAENKDVIDNTLRSIIARLEARDSALAGIDPATYKIPALPERPQPTQDELKAIAVSLKEAELNAEIQRVEQEAKIAELAKEHSSIAAKLAEVEAEKRK